ncbi:MULTISPECIES: PSP1 domain-containing protein [Anaerostipes]|uniref:PSP1 domain-containing protein n=1 Tax=Anaerostipes TaxID=207244 RepID=UPI0009517BB1|nr:MULTISPECIES: stage 0 sporulation family protein [Anaerostipes]MCI5622874.1 stage 0 sporulation family protein [Anaerostipes sp.]MDY2725667.1 stage 0 sporulation family protein [Anaerostipes faecalis]OLR59517.1 stage 0 sporulation protein [Anaerostipes sp. 494a]
MVEVIGVRFRTAGKIYFFDPRDFQVKMGEHVIVETSRGIEYGKVVSERRMVKEKCVREELKPVLRIATPEDDQKAIENREKEKEAYKICQEKIKEHNLEMKLVSTEYTFDNNKVLFYFTADGRVDFRELVKDLASVFRTRIELRQIGVRDEAKMLGGIGICGRKLCCNTFLSEFAPVSIKMAKEQNLSLNPTKISGVCGRLMCCLKNEQETYEYLNSKLPKIGEIVKAKDGITGEVQRVDVLRQKVKLIVEDENGDKDIQEYKIDDLLMKRKKQGCPGCKGNGKRKN